MSRPLQIVHLSLGLNLGGMERLLVEFARHADRAKVALRFISITTRGPAADEIEALGFRVEALRQPPGLSATLPFRIASLLHRARADVLHTHNTKPLLYGVAAARLAGVGAIVHTRHGQRHGATRRQTMLFNLAARGVDRVVAVSHDSARLASAQGLDPARLETIHNGIDVSRFVAQGPKTDGPALFVGRLSREKDLPTLLRAMQIIHSRGQSLRLNIAGSGSCRAELEQLTAQLGLSDRVTFLGEVHDVPALLARSSMLVLSSLSEGISLALLEAMAAGLPVVATRVGGNVEVVGHQETGLLVEPSAPEQLAHAMLNLHTEPERSKQMGFAGRARAEQLFDARRMVGQYQALYEQVYHQRRRRRSAA